MNYYRQHCVFSIAIVLLSTKINSMDQQQPLQRFTILKHTFVQSRKDRELYNSADNQFCLIDRPDLIHVSERTTTTKLATGITTLTTDVLTYDKTSKTTTSSRSEDTNGKSDINFLDLQSNANLVSIA